MPNQKPTPSFRINKRSIKPFTRLQKATKKADNTIINHAIRFAAANIDEFKKRVNEEEGD